MFIKIATPLALFIAFSVLIVLGKHFKLAGIKSKILVILFLIKLFAAVSITMIYTHYYNPATADIFKYYNGGLEIYRALEDRPGDYFKMITGIKADEPQLHQYYDAADFWYKEFDYGLYNDNRTMIRFNAILCLISNGNIWVHVVVMAFLSFLGSYWLLLGFKKFIRIRNSILILATFLIPTLLIWSSGLLKEGLVIFGLGALFLTTINIRQNFKWWHLMVLVLSGFLLVLAKFYILLCIVPSLVFIWITARYRLKKPLVILAPIVLLIVLVFSTSKYYSPLDLPLIIEQKQSDFVKMLNSMSDAGSTISIPDLEPNIGSFIINLPHAVFNSFMRPHIGEVTFGLSMFAAIENLLFLLFIVFVIIFYRKPSPPLKTMFWANITFVLFLFTLVGLTTPNLGALVRYKMPALPFLFLALYVLVGNQKLPRKIRELNIFME
ncbi:MAG TPA: hypothetical protein PLO05_05065 [Bacteroidales bacterium]|jgi:hypothetical protein|nr:hypothetical protein [Bacteroidales bacterium]MDD4236775.1 hypothetical protein [Bacteroidales bacterium]MDD4578899.1 hypothetical protein [Anaerolineaceae bacterium]HXK81509.1 hypothetical protein [Bacteroidales bacterium]